MKKSWFTIGVLGLGILATACGSAKAATQTPTPSAQPTTAPTPSPNPALGDYPPQDTTLAQAATSNPVLADAWQALGIQKTIPGADIFAAQPAMPVPKDDTGGAMTNTQVAAIEVAIWRAETLIQWGEAHDEIAFLQTSVLGQQEANPIFAPDASAALDTGGTVIDPNCDIYSTSVAVYTPNAAINKWIAANGYTMTGPDAILLSFNEANCELTITSHGHVTTESADPNHSHGVDLVLWVGEVEQDPTLGDFFKLEASSDCDGPDAVLHVCHT